MAARADVAVGSLARKQHGLFTLGQAIARGVSIDQIHHRLLDGRLHRVGPSVYAVASVPTTWRGELLGAVLARPRAIASGFSAGRLIDIKWCRGDVPEVTVPSTGNARLDDAIVHRRSDFFGIDTVEIDAIPSMTAAEVLFDIAHRTSRVRLETMVDDAIVRGLVTPNDLEEVLDRVTGMRLKGTRKYRAVIGGLVAGYTPPESLLERKLYDILESPLIPGYRRQASLEWWDRLPHRVDAVIDDWRLIVEADGRAYHTKREDFETDRLRDNLAAAHGYRVMRFTWAMLTESPIECIGLLLTVARASHRE